MSDKERPEGLDDLHALRKETGKMQKPTHKYTGAVALLAQALDQREKLHVNPANARSNITRARMFIDMAAARADGDATALTNSIGAQLGYPDTESFLTDLLRSGVDTAIQPREGQEPDLGRIALIGTLGQAAEAEDPIEFRRQLEIAAIEQGEPSAFSMLHNLIASGPGTSTPNPA